MPQIKLFSVTVKLRSQPAAVGYEVRAADHTCALGVVLEVLEEELGSEPDIETVTVSTDVDQQLAHYDPMNQQIREAFELALAQPE